MHLSQLVFDPATAAAAHYLRNARDLNSVLTVLAPSKSDRMLWRLDVDRPKEPHLLVLSTSPLRMQELAKEAAVAPHRTRPYGPVLDSITKGSEFGFRLTLSATKDISQGPDRKSKRIAVSTPEGITDWFAQRSEQLGFDIVSPGGIEVSSPVKHPVSYGTHTSSVATNEVRGRLLVNDAEAMRSAMTRGIGRGRAQGCGLLTLSS